MMHLYNYSSLGISQLKIGVGSIGMYLVLGFSKELNKNL